MRYNISKKSEPTPSQSSTSNSSPISDIANDYTDHQLLLERLQANILKHHGKDFASYLLITFAKGELAKAKNWIRGIEVSCAWDQFQMPKQDLPIIRCIYVSYAGYNYLYQGCKLLGNRLEAFSGGLTQRTAFRGTARTRENNYEKEVHVLLLLAANDENSLTIEKDKHTRALEKFASIFCESGRRSTDLKHKYQQEWFGFRDGISNPRFFTDPKKRQKLEEKGEFQANAKLELVLKKDPDSSYTNAFGSMVVFLKLEQHCDNFDAVVKNISSNYNITEKHAAALIIGRHPEGTPVTLSATPNPNLPTDNFDYEQDQEGYKCPFHAHIRKVNPRTACTEDLRIARRGMIYGQQDEKKKGLLFMSFQKNLQLQFEDMVNRWMFGYDEDHRGDAFDPFFEHLQNTSQDYARKYSPIWGKKGPNYISKQRIIKPLITFRGGYYFFAPAIDTLKHL